VAIRKNKEKMENVHKHLIEIDQEVKYDIKKTIDHQKSKNFGKDALAKKLQIC